MTWVNISPKMIYQWRTGARRDACIISHQRYQTETTGSHLLPTGTATIKNPQRNRHDWQGCEETRPSVQSGAATMENSTAGPRRMKYRSTTWSSKPTADLYAKSGKQGPQQTSAHSCSQRRYSLSQDVVTEATRVSTEGRMNKRSVTATCNGVLLALNRKEIPTCATTQINLEDIMPSEISQSQKDKHCMTAFVRSLK